jgi:hypothetical protein
MLWKPPQIIKIIAMLMQANMQKTNGNANNIIIVHNGSDRPARNLAADETAKIM